jgi:hypothetical protein
MVQTKYILLRFLVIFSLFLVFGCENEQEEKTWIMKVRVNKHLSYPYTPTPAEDHSGVRVICQNGTGTVSALTDSLGIAELKGLDFGTYDIILKLEGTKKLYCSEDFNKNLDTLAMDIYQFHKDTLKFRYEIMEDKICAEIKLWNNGRNTIFRQEHFSFLYYFFSDKPDVSRYKFDYVYDELIFALSNVGYRLFCREFENLFESGYEKNDSVYFKVYAGLPNISVCQRDTSEVTYYYGFSDSTRTFGFVMP